MQGFLLGVMRKLSESGDGCNNLRMYTKKGSPSVCELYLHKAAICNLINKYEFKDDS